jgi:hypothetical protein
MPEYVALINWTEQGVRDFKNTVDRLPSSPQTTPLPVERLVIVSVPSPLSVTFASRRWAGGHGAVPCPGHRHRRPTRSRTSEK